MHMDSCFVWDTKTKLSRSIQKFFESTKVLRLNGWRNELTRPFPLAW
ncbi:hypothetical protein Thiowin_03108 [Thiorhodovibrio winogradskyi]|uniref:Uncharacterized protein n=1 Tax=Thiorhodovibrio winogradskyi TaxID=77007 RepID=A0ABZ0SD61_9GAMM